MVHGNLAVHYHKGYARRELTRIVVCGIVYDPFGVEYYDICIKTFLNPPTLCQAKPSRRTIGHPVDHFPKAEDAELTAQPAQKSREGPV